MRGKSEWGAEKEKPTQFSVSGKTQFSPTLVSFFILLPIFPAGSGGKASAYNAGRPGFNPWVRKIPWRRKWQPTPVLLPGKIPWTEEPGRLQPMGLQRVRHNWATSLSFFFFLLSHRTLHFWSPNLQKFSPTPSNSLRCESGVQQLNQILKLSAGNSISSHRLRVWSCKPAATPPEVSTASSRSPVIHNFCPVCLQISGFHNPLLRFG